MSTLVYGALTRKRVLAPANLDISTWPPGLGNWTDTIAAIFPAEVLLGQAVALTLTTQRGRDAITGYASATFATPRVAVVAYLVLLIASCVFYVIAYIRTAERVIWHRANWMRMLIPPLAFIIWTVGQPGSLFDAIVPEMNGALRASLIICGSIVLITGAVLLSRQASRTQGEVRQSG